MDVKFRHWFFSRINFQRINFQRSTHLHVVTHSRGFGYARCAHLLFMLLFSLNVCTSSPRVSELSASIRAYTRARGRKRACAGGIHYGKCTERVRSHMRARLYARLHTNTRECAHAITDELPRHRSAPSCTRGNCTYNYRAGRRNY